MPAPNIKVQLDTSRAKRAASDLRTEIIGIGQAADRTNRKLSQMGEQFKRTRPGGGGGGGRGEPRPSGGEGGTGVLNEFVAGGAVAGGVTGAASVSAGAQSLAKQFDAQNKSAKQLQKTLAQLGRQGSELTEQQQRIATEAVQVIKRQNGIASASEQAAQAQKKQTSVLGGLIKRFKSLGERATGGRVFQGATNEVNQFSRKAAEAGQNTSSFSQRIANLNDSVQVALGPLSGVASRISAASQIFNRAGVQVAAFTGTLVGAGALTFAVQRAAEEITQLNEQAESLGVSFQNLQKLRFSLQQFGIQDARDALGTFREEISDIIVDPESDMAERLSRIFQATNTQIKDLRGLKADEQLFKVAEAFRASERSALEATVGTRIFGEEQRELIGVVNRGAKPLREQTKLLKRLNLVLSDEVVGAAGKTRRAFNLLFHAVRVGSLRVLSSFFSTVSDNKGTLTELAGAIGTASKQVKGFFSALQGNEITVKNMNDNLLFTVQVLNRIRAGFGVISDVVGGTFQALSAMGRAAGAQVTALAGGRLDLALAARARNREALGDAISRIGGAFQGAGQGLVPIGELREKLERQAGLRKPLPGLRKETDGAKESSRGGGNAASTSQGNNKDTNESVKKNVAPLSDLREQLNALRAGGRRAFQITQLEQEIERQRKIIDEKTKLVAPPDPELGLRLRPGAKQEPRRVIEEGARRKVLQAQLEIEKARNRIQDLKEKASRESEDASGGLTDAITFSAKESKFTRSQLNRQLETLKSSGLDAFDRARQQQRRGILQRRARLQREAAAGFESGLDPFTIVSGGRTPVQRAATTISRDLRARSLQNRIEAQRIAKQLAKSSEDAANKAKTAFDRVGTSIRSNVINGLTDAIVKAEDFGDVFEGVLRSVQRSIANNLVARPLVNNLIGTPAKGGGLNTKGSLLEGLGNIIGDIFSSSAQSANGNVFTGPSLTTVSENNNPEAVLPLSRGPGGQLGVQAGGGGGVTVNVINNTGAQVNTEEREGPQGPEIDVVVDEAVARRIDQNGATARSLRRNFGLERTGIRR